MNADNLEIERKFLIRYPGPGQLALCASETHIDQTYLVNGEKGCTERVRRRGHEGCWTYTHTVKTRVSDLRRVELEGEISRSEYELLLKKADPERRIIRKTRYCLEYGGLIFEIDVYPFWSDRAVMEVELANEEQDFAFPPSIEVLREISHDRRYTNASLARSVPCEEV